MTPEEIPTSPEQSARADENPWKSLNFYTENDRNIFFGREKEQEEVVRLVMREALTIVFGRSGLGKTSLLRAGVVPHLREEGYLPVIKRVVYASSAESPTRQIRSELFKAAHAAGMEVEDTAHVEGQPEQPDRELTLWEIFHRYRLWGPRNDIVIPVLILDQFEEVFTNGRHSRHTSDFLEQLGDLVENRMPVPVVNRTDETGERLTFDTRVQNYRLILSLREDFVPKLDALRESMPSMLRNRFMLTPLNMQQGIRIVRGPGEKWVPEEVAERIVTAVAGQKALSETAAEEGLVEIEPAYLSIMCYELFKIMKETGRKAIDASLVTTEQSNILDAMYKRSFQGVSPATRSFIEDRLISASGFRLTVPLAEVNRENIPQDEIARLVNRHIIRTEERLGTIHVELTHDLLTGVVKKSRDARIATKELEEEQHREAELAAELKRTRRHAAIAIWAVVILAVGILFSWLGWWKDHVTYSRSFAKRWGAILPVGSLSRSAVAHRSYSLRATKKGWFGNVRLLEVVDSNRNLTPRHDIKSYLAESESDDIEERPCRFEFIYDKRGRIVYEVARDRLQRLSWTFVHVPAGQGGHDRTKGFFINAEGYPMPQGHSRAEVVEIRYDNRGFESELYYQDRRGNSVPGPDDAFGMHLVYDSKGRLLEQVSVDDKNRPMNDAIGNAGQRFSYDNDGNVVETHAFDARGEETLLLKSNIHSIKMRYDRWGRQIERRYFGLSHEPVVEQKDQLAHKVTFDYDDQGNARSIKLYDRDDNNMEANVFNGTPAHEIRMTYDAMNRIASQSYFDRFGNPATCGSGWHALTYEYDKNGFLSSITMRDRENNRALSSDGFCIIKITNDSYGRRIEERYFDASLHEVMQKDGYHLVRTSYDRAGNPVMVKYFDQNNRGVKSEAGYHAVERTYDIFRHCRTEDYLDEKLRPVQCRARYHRIDHEYDRSGAETATRWFDENEGPCLGPEGVHLIRKSYDNLGLIRSQTRWDATNSRVVNRYGIHETRYRHNDKRQLTVIQHVDVSGRPAEDNDGLHIYLADFDERGRQIRERKFRADGRPALDPELGIAIKSHVYDKQNRWVEQIFYNEKEQLTTGPYGYARGVIIYDQYDRSNLFYYGPDKKLVINRLTGYAQQKLDPRTTGTTRDSFHDDHGNLVNGPDGFAEACRTWGKAGKLLEQCWYGTHHEPVVGPPGYHRTRYADDGKIVAAYSVANRELSTAERQRVVPIIYINGIVDLKQPAVKIGLHPGDIIWRYGSWFFIDAVKKESVNGKSPEAIGDAVGKSFIEARKRQSENPVLMEVIRGNRIVQVRVPPLKGRLIGVTFRTRNVPDEVVATWKTAVR